MRRSRLPIAMVLLVTGIAVGILIAGAPAEEKKSQEPISIKEGDRRIRLDFEEWAVWSEGERASGGTAVIRKYADPAASGKEVAGIAFAEVADEKERQWVSYPFYISSTFFRYDYDVWMRYATKEMGIDCEFIYQEGDKFEGPKAPISIARMTMKPTANWRGTYRWERLGTINTTRAWHQIIVKSAGGTINVDAFVFVTHSAYVEDGRADRDIADKNAGIYTAGGVALGGIGVGKLELCRDGKIRNVVTNNNVDAPLNELNGTFFAARAKKIGDDSIPPVLRALVLRSEYNLPAVAGIEYKPLFPTVAMDFKDPALPIDVRLDAFSPLIPNNVKDSSLPVAFFEFTLENRSKDACEAAVAVSWENLVGLGAWGDPRRYFYWDDRDGNKQRFAAADGMKGIVFTNRGSRSPLADGDYTLACLDQDGVEVSYNLQWDITGDGASAWGPFAKTGRFSDDRLAATGNPGAAILATGTTLRAGEKRSIRFVVAWDMPNLISSKGRPYGHAHNNHFKGSWAVADYAMKNHDRLEAGSRMVQKHLLVSSLPGWFVRRLLTDAFPIYANTWLTKDYKFSVSESPNNMNGCMGTMDQRFVAGIFNAIFFTELDKMELSLFGLSQSEKNGSIPHELGHSDLDTNIGKGGGDWPDLSLSFVLQCYRRYLWTADEDFMRDMYPRMKKALEYGIVGLDKDGDGIPNVRGGLLGCSYDAQLTYGNVDYIGSMALAALLAMEDLAGRRGDAEFAKKCHAWFEKARASFESELWNGSYFRHYREIVPRVVDGVPQPLQVSEACHLAQLAGQWFADSVGLGPIQDADKIEKAVAAMARLNGNPRWRCPPDEVDPNGNLIFSHEVSWVLYIEAFFCSLALRHGHPDDGFRIAENINKTIEREGNDPFDVRLMYQPRDGAAAWGRWYMTAPASWNILNALEGFTVDLPAKRIGLSPALPESFNGRLSAPLFSPKLWAWLDYSESWKGGGLECTFNLRWLEGSPSKEVSFESAVFTVPQGAEVIVVEIDGKRVEGARLDEANRKLVVSRPFQLAEGKQTAITIRYYRLEAGGK